MIEIVIVLSLFAVALAAALAFTAAHVDVATSPGAGTLFFVSPAMPPRPRGVQEEDLPRFVFRDRVASSEAGATAPALAGLGAPVPC